MDEAGTGQLHGITPRLVGTSSAPALVTQPAAINHARPSATARCPTISSRSPVMGPCVELSSGDHAHVDAASATSSVPETHAHVGAIGPTRSITEPNARAGLASRFDAVVLRTQAKAALTGLVWKPAVARAAVAAAVAAQGAELTLERLIFESLRRCPAPTSMNVTAAVLAEHRSRPVYPYLAVPNNVAGSSSMFSRGTNVMIRTGADVDAPTRRVPTRIYGPLANAKAADAIGSTSGHPGISEPERLALAASPWESIFVEPRRRRLTETRGCADRMVRRDC